MNKKIFLLFIFLCLASFSFISLRSVSQQNKNDKLAKPKSNLDIPCYPKDYRNPISVAKFVLLQKEYSYILAISKSGNDSNRFAREFIFEQDKSRNLCINHEISVRPFSDFLPKKVAVDFKKRRWNETLNVMGSAKFKKLLNTPPEIPNPFYLYKEDVEALSMIGFKPGEKAKVIEKYGDLDDLYKMDKVQ